MSSISTQEKAQSLKYRMRWWTLLVLSVSLLILIVDDTIVNVAIPTLQRELGATASSLQWIVASYILVFAGLLLTMGSLGDRFGRKRMLQVGLVIFGLASVFAAYAQTSGQLIGARAVMGLGGALIMPSTLSIIVNVFPREERGKAIGIWTGVAGLGIPLGPVLGGWLIGQFWWGSIFLINIPVVLAALGAGLFLVPESRNPTAPKMDIPGVALSSGALIALVYAVIEAPERGWLDPVVLGGFAAALVGSVGFVARELHTDHLMLDLRLFRNPRFPFGTSTMALVFLAFIGVVYILTQYLQIVLGYTPLEAGVRVLPLALGFVIGAGGSSALVAKLGTKWVVTGGLSIVAATMVALSFLDVGTAYWMIGIGLGLLGIGVGTTMAPATDAIVGAVPEDNAGIGSAVNETASQVGAALGIAILGTVVNSAYSSNVADAVTGLPAETAAVAQNFVGAAAQIAASMGGPAGDALRTAANTAFVDALGVALPVGAAIAFVGALLVAKFMPARQEPLPEVRPEEGKAPSAHQPVLEPVLVSTNE